MNKDTIERALDEAFDDLRFVHDVEEFKEALRPILTDLWDEAQAPLLARLAAVVGRLENHRLGDLACRVCDDAHRSALGDEILALASGEGGEQAGAGTPQGNLTALNDVSTEPATPDAPTWMCAVCAGQWSVSGHAAELAHLRSVVAQVRVWANRQREFADPNEGGRVLYAGELLAILDTMKGDNDGV